ncbi:MAG: hypothetical protein KDB07_10655, partial [Planctomycetes bacterium]|nr:hypothetical protein [Planctomycetota bacterium]
ILKTYWFKVFADKRKQTLKPPLADRPSLVTGDSGVKRIEPEPEPYVRYPMPDDGTPVPDEIEQSFDEMGGHMPSPALAMDTTHKLTPHLEAAMEDAWREAGEPDGFDEGGGEATFQSSPLGSL